MAMIRSLAGTWNINWDTWLPGKPHHPPSSPWLLFGFYACFSTLDAATDPVVATTPDAVSASHGKPVYSKYSVTGIPGDGRCLFRAVAHGAALRNGEDASCEHVQRDLADDLRNKVVDELAKRRAETEWFIEGDFDTYVERMKQPRVWGGEPELLMASHVLKMPIGVYMRSERDSNGIISIAEYGQEYGKDSPIRVLYHGYGHYDALQVLDTSSTTTGVLSKL